jgi:periplasmic mercuric ion binding protein
MIKERFTLVILVTIFFCFSMFAQQGPSRTIYFTTLGNCGICQNRIQNAVKNMPGIDTVYWNIPKKQTTVSYDESVTNPYTIMHAIANAGHDNEWFRAPDSAYNLLVGSCCEYQRTIDYDTVKVGYLSMLGIWIYPLGIHEKTQPEFIVYPAIGSGVFNISVKGSMVNSGFVVSVYSMYGIKVHERRFTPGSKTAVDLTSFPDGEYVIVISDKSGILSSNRLIKVQ